MIGRIYHLGKHGVARNYTAAAEYYNKAEKLGDLRATNKIGEMIFKG